MMKPLFHKFFPNIRSCFWGYCLLWQFLAITLTFVIVGSGFDWYYFQFSRSAILDTILFPAVVIGFFLPIIGPFMVLAYGYIRKNVTLIHTAWALGQAGVI